MSASADGQLFASVAEDGSAKVFDVVNFGEFCFVSMSEEWCYNVEFDRHDQYAEVAVYTECLLLGASEGTSTRAVSYVRVEYSPRFGRKY